MKQKWIPMILTSLLVVLALACSAGAPTVAPANPVSPAASTAVPPTELVIPTLTPNVQATVDAAIAATSQAQLVVQTTVNAAVASIVVAMPPTATPVPPVDPNTLSEEELEAMINQAVNEAVAATTQATAATTQTTSDDALTAEEVAYMEIYVAVANQAIVYAEQLLTAYSQVYGDLAYAALGEVSQMEQELASMSSSISSLDSTLEAVNTTIQTGQELAQDTINQLETAAQAASANLPQTQDQVKNWQQHTDKGREDRANQIASIQPDNVPADLQSTIRDAFSFVDQINTALGDGKLNMDELTQIGQLGANISAGFNKHGGVKMQGMSGKVNDITMNLARGQLPKARGGLGDFEKGLGQRPANLPKPSLPSLPKRP
jgi:hypothetical protein